MKRKSCLLFVSLFLVLFGSFRPAFAEDPHCPGADNPPPPVLKADLSKLIAALEKLKDTNGRNVWQTTDETKAALKEIFESTPTKTKLEQFFQLLFLLQEHIENKNLPMVVEGAGITDVLLEAKVFTDSSFPKKITKVELKHDDPNRAPFYTVDFSDKEVRFPINQGNGFANWDQGMCQVAKQLVFYNPFSFRVRKNRVNPNLVVDDFSGVQIFGDFGSRGMFSIDLNYVDLEKVEFIKGTDQGKVKARVAEREFKENKHSKWFKFIGTMIPNTSRQRIDW
ncbi:MAG: hypothetical protein U1F57_09830 [bacterium]